MRFEDQDLANRTEDPANYKRFEKYAAQHKKAFNAWVEDKLARWLNPVPRIRETGLPATLENITRHMLESKGMEGLIVDLRNNGGGLLDAKLRWRPVAGSV